MGPWDKWGSCESGTAGGDEEVAGHCLLLPLSGLGRTQGHEESGGHPVGPGMQADLHAYRFRGSPGGWEEWGGEWPGQGL